MGKPFNLPETGDPNTRWVIDDNTESGMRLERKYPNHPLLRKNNMSNDNKGPETPKERAQRLTYRDRNNTEKPD